MSTNGTTADNTATIPLGLFIAMLIVPVPVVIGLAFFVEMKLHLDFARKIGEWEGRMWEGVKGFGKSVGGKGKGGGDVTGGEREVGGGDNGWGGMLSGWRGRRRGAGKEDGGERGEVARVGEGVGERSIELRELPKVHVREDSKTLGAQPGYYSSV